MQADEELTALTFKQGDLYLHANLSEQLLGILVETGRLNDKTFSVFRAKNTNLEKVALKNSSNLSRRGLKRVLQQHHIIDLEANQLKVTISDLINCLSEWTLKNLRSLDVSGCTFVDGSKMPVMISLSMLRNLRSLNVGYTEFNNHGLEIVVEDLRHLECLDITETRVSDISPLRKCRNRLRALIMHNLKVRPSARNSTI